jgi:hypothetical protein
MAVSGITPASFSRKYLSMISTELREAPKTMVGTFFSMRSEASITALFR